MLLLLGFDHTTRHIEHLLGGRALLDSSCASHPPTRLGGGGCRDEEEPGLPPILTTCTTTKTSHVVSARRGLRKCSGWLFMGTAVCQKHTTCLETLVARVGRLWALMCVKSAFTRPTLLQRWWSFMGTAVCQKRTRLVLVLRAGVVVYGHCCVSKTYYRPSPAPSSAARGAGLGCVRARRNA